MKHGLKTSRQQTRNPAWNKRADHKPPLHQRPWKAKHEAHRAGETCRHGQRTASGGIAARWRAAAPAPLPPPPPAKARRPGKGWMDGQMDGWMDGRIDGWMDGWMDGWTRGDGPAAPSPGSSSPRPAACPLAEAGAGTSRWPCIASRAGSRAAAHSLRRVFRLA